MSTHPNAMIILAITPDGLARKTYRDILADEKIEDDDDEIKISGIEYSHRVMEDDYYEPSQVSAKEGDIVLWDLVTYGYGETIEWSDLEARKINLENWAKVVCAKHHCSYKIFISANYW